ncbi:MAG: MMPL family transporter [Clostridiales bacterium]|nr:MMPL family transporter [Clostridiales bacterium]
MRKIANFIVEHRILTLIMVLTAAAFCGMLALRVDINSDMTKYLSESSSMKQGMDVMQEEFPDLEDRYTIRVMFSGLPYAEKPAIKAELESIPYVESVEYKADDRNYNIDEHSLYIISTLHDYESAEMRSIESALDARFPSYTMVYMNDDGPGTGLTAQIILIAVSFAMVILFVMCESWLEPILFLAVMGVAILFNMGTNVFLGSISVVTASISAVLQLTLSMDYSIMLLDRYRQKLEHTDDIYEAMKNALVEAFAAITGSSVTTIVGLLALVFMNFKIGRDLGFVLAKGVFFSLFCILTILPAVVLLCDKAIRKTEKKVLQINLDAVSRFAFRYRYILTGGFVVLLAGGFLLQTQTHIAYTMEKPDPIQEVFPTTNTVLILFDNDDEQTITDITGYLEENEYVKSVSSFSTTIGKPYSSAELADELNGMEDTDIDLDATVLDILYYYAFMNGATGSISAGDFLRFILDDVLNNQNFADRLDEEIRDNLDMLSLFADKAELSALRSVSGIASAFKLDEKDVADLLAYYFGEYGGSDAGRMTLPEFVGFIRSDILTDEDFSDLLDAETRDRMDTLTIMTDRDELTEPKTAQEISEALDMALRDTEMLMMVYQARKETAGNQLLSFPQFADLLIDKVLADSRFDDAIRADERKDAEKLAEFAEPGRFQAKRDSGEFAAALGMDPDQAELLYMFYFAEQGAADSLQLSFPRFSDLLLNEILADSRFDEAIDEEVRKDADKLAELSDPLRFQAERNSAGIADALGLDPDQAELLYMFYFAEQGAADNLQLSFPQFADLLLNEILADSRFDEAIEEDVRKEADKLAVLADTDRFQAKGTSEEIAEMLDMDPDQVELLYMLYFARYGAPNWITVDVSTFLSMLTHEVMEDYRFAGQFDPDTRNQLRMLGAFGDRESIMMDYTPESLAGLLGLDRETAAFLFALYTASRGSGDPGSMPISEFVRFLMEDIAGHAAFASLLDDAQRQQIGMLSVFTDANTLLAEYTIEQMAYILSSMGLAPSVVEMLYTMHYGSPCYNCGGPGYIEVSPGVFEPCTVCGGYGFTYSGDTAGLTMTLSEFIDLLIGFLNAAPEGAPVELLALKALKDAALAGYPLDIGQTAAITGMEPELLAPLFLYHRTLVDGYRFPPATLYDLLRFIARELGPSGFGGEELARLSALADLMDAVIAGQRLNAANMAALLGMEAEMARILFAYHFSLEGYTGDWLVSLRDLVDFVLDDLAEGVFRDMIKSSDIADLEMARTLMRSTLSARHFTAAELADLVDMAPDTLKLVYAYYLHLYGDTSAWLLSLQGLVDFVLDDLAVGEFRDAIEESDLDDLEMARSLMRSTLSGQLMTAAELADLVDMAPDTLKLVYAYHLHLYGDTSDWLLSLQGLVDFVLDDLAVGEFRDSIKESDLDDLEMARSLMRSTLTGRLMTAVELADLVDMAPDMLRVLYAYHTTLYGDTTGWLLTLQNLVEYILTDLSADEDFNDVLDADTLDDLRTLQRIINGTLAGTFYSPDALANLLDMDRDSLLQLYYLRISRYGDIRDWMLSIHAFIRFIHDDVLTDADLSGRISAGDADRLAASRRLADAVANGESFSYGDMTAMFDGLAKGMTANQMKLLYVYYFSRTDTDPGWRFSIIDLFHYLVDDILPDPVFAEVFEDKDRQTLLDARADIDDAVGKLTGPNYSLMSIATTFPGESDDTRMFIRSLMQDFSGNLSGGYYLIGNAAMNYEMSQTFGRENLLISLLTAGAIFTVVALTFRSLILPAILVLVIQCSVFLTVSIIGLQGYSIFYLALIIVQCILMGATIDYGILFASYYMEKRKTLSPAEALTAAYNGSIHTILTSGLILIIVIGFVGMFFENPVNGEICQTISIGAICSSVLIIFILPGIIALCDKLVTRKI